jgi:hypothetical protein
MVTQTVNGNQVLESLTRLWNAAWRGGWPGLSKEQLQPKGHSFGSRKNGPTKAGTALDKILLRLWYLCWNLTV